MVKRTIVTIVQTRLNFSPSEASMSDASGSTSFLNDWLIFANYFGLMLISIPVLINSYSIDNVTG